MCIWNYKCRFCGFQLINTFSHSLELKFHVLMFIFILTLQIHLFADFIFIIAITMQIMYEQSE